MRLSANVCNCQPMNATVSQWMRLSANVCAFRSRSLGVFDDPAPPTPLLSPKTTSTTLAIKSNRTERKFNWGRARPWDRKDDWSLGAPDDVISLVDHSIVGIDPNRFHLYWLFIKNPLKYDNSCVSCFFDFRDIAPQRKKVNWNHGESFGST